MKSVRSSIFMFSNNAWVFANISFLLLREKLANTCIEVRSKRILITHGTDSMIETAAYLSKRVTDKTIVMTGAFLPETFKATDADFNVGFALGVLSTLSVTGVFIAMNGKVSLWSKCTRNPDTDMFEGTL